MDFFVAKINSIFSPYANRNKFIKIYLGIANYLPPILISVLLIGLLISTSVNAEKKSILIITDNKVQINTQVSTILKPFFLKNQEFSVKILQYQNILQNHTLLDQASLIITLGINATLYSPLSLTAPTIHALIPQSTIKKIGLCSQSNCQKKKTQMRCRFAIYLDQPLSRQLNLISLLLPSAKKVGVLTASFSASKLPSLQIEAKKLNIEISEKHIKNRAMLNRQLNNLISNIDILFTLPDPMLHNKETIPYLLLSTYRYNIPVIGFSKAYVNAGAIAAVYSSAEQISQQISELSINALSSPSTIISSSFPPKYFSIAINESVTKSLGLHLADKQTIKSKLLLLEK
jgi:hypothetical protein